MIEQFKRWAFSSTLTFTLGFIALVISVIVALSLLGLKNDFNLVVAGGTMGYFYFNAYREALEAKSKAK